MLLRFQCHNQGDALISYRGVRLWWTRLRLQGARLTYLTESISDLTFNAAQTVATISDATQTALNIPPPEVLYQVPKELPMGSAERAQYETRISNLEEIIERLTREKGDEKRRADRASQAYAHLDNRRVIDLGEDEWDDRTHVEEE